MNFFGGGG